MIDPALEWTDESARVDQSNPVTRPSEVFALITSFLHAS
jgi:hypothetical protein